MRRSTHCPCGRKVWQGLLPRPLTAVGRRDDDGPARLVGPAGESRAHRSTGAHRNRISAGHPELGGDRWTMRSRATGTAARIGDRLGQAAWSRRCAHDLLELEGGRPPKTGVASAAVGVFDPGDDADPEVVPAGPGLAVEDFLSQERVVRLLEQPNSLLGLSQLTALGCGRARRDAALDIGGLDSVRQTRLADPEAARDRLEQPAGSRPRATRPTSSRTALG